MTTTLAALTQRRSDCLVQVQTVKRAGHDPAPEMEALRAATMDLAMASVPRNELDEAERRLVFVVEQAESWPGLGLSRKLERDRIERANSVMFMLSVIASLGFFTVIAGVFNNEGANLVAISVGAVIAVVSAMLVGCLYARRTAMQNKYDARETRIKLRSEQEARPVRELRDRLRAEWIQAVNIKCAEFLRVNEEVLVEDDEKV